MNLGREIVACALRAGTLSPFTDAGITAAWLTSTSTSDLTRHAIFDDTDAGAYGTLLRHWDQHGKLPTLELFQKSHPAVSYRLPDSEYTPGELVEQFHQDRRRYLTEVTVSDLADLTREERYDDAIALMGTFQATVGHRQHVP